MITSLGTCRLVIPRSESTIARPAGRVRLRDRLLDVLAGVRGKQLDRGQHARQPVRRVRADPSSASPCSAKTSAKYARTASPKMIGSETFIIVAFMWTEKRTPQRLRVGDLRARGLVQRPPAHHGGVDDLARPSAFPVLEHGHRPVGARRARCAARPGAHRRRLLRRAEVVRPPWSPRASRVLGPRAHRVRVLAGEGLHGRGRTAVGVALAQHGVDRAALDRVVDLARVPRTPARRGPASRSSLIAAFSCGIEAETFGSLTMFASGVLASSPSSPSASGSLPERGEDAARGRDVAQLDLDPGLRRRTPRGPGSSEWVARAGASSVYV